MDEKQEGGRAKIMKRIFLMGLMGIILLGGCSGKNGFADVPKLNQPVGVEVDIVRVEKKDLSNETIFTGQIVPKIVEAAFEISGNIKEMKVSVGDKVKKGDLLATLGGADEEMRKDLDRTIQEAKKQFSNENKVGKSVLDTLKKELRQLKQSYQKKKSKELKNQMITKEYDIRIQKKKMEQAKEIQNLEIQKQQDEWKKLSASSGNKKLYAPIDGEIISIIGGSGHMVQAGGSAVSLADMAHPRVKTEYISSTMLNKANRYVAVVNGREYEVKVEKVIVDRYSIETGIGMPTETNFDFIGKAGSVKIGDFALIRVRNDVAEDALVVPANAVQKDSAGRYVYVREEGGKVRRDVTIGTSTDACVQLLTGVKEGEVVYVES